MSDGFYVAKGMGNLWWYQDRFLVFFEKMENTKNEE